MTFDGKEMQWYSVWGRQEMEVEELAITFDVEPPPPTALLLCVSEAAAAVVERDLFKLCAEHRHMAGTGETATLIFLRFLCCVVPRFNHVSTFSREVQPLHPADPQRRPGWDRRDRVLLPPGAQLPQKL